MKTNAWRKKHTTCWMDTKHSHCALTHIHWTENQATRCWRAVTQTSWTEFPAAKLIMKCQETFESSPVDSELPSRYQLRINYSRNGAPQMPPSPEERSWGKSMEWRLLIGMTMMQEILCLFLMEMPVSLISKLWLVSKCMVIPETNKCGVSRNRGKLTCRRFPLGQFLVWLYKTKWAYDQQHWLQRHHSCFYGKHGQLQHWSVWIINDRRSVEVSLVPQCTTQIMIHGAWKFRCAQSARIFVTSTQRPSTPHVEPKPTMAARDKRQTYRTFDHRGKLSSLGTIGFFW